MTTPLGTRIPKRPIHLVRQDKVRPFVVLTRESVRPYLSVGRANGLDRDSVVSCDNIHTIPVSALGEQIGFLLDSQEHDLIQAVQAAFDLDG